MTIEIVQSGAQIPAWGHCTWYGELHGAEQGLGIVRDISPIGPPAHGTFVGRPAILFGGSASHHINPATEADRIPGVFAASGQYEMAFEFRPVWPITGSGGILAAPAADEYPQIKLTTAPRIQFLYKGMDGNVYTITSDHTLTLNTRACIRVRVTFANGRPTLIVNNCTYAIPYDETGVEVSPISDDTVYDPAANLTYVGVIGQDAHCYLTSMSFYNAALSNDESAHLARFPLHYMHSSFGDKLIDGISFREGTGDTVAAKSSRSWSITGATWDVGTHGGQTWTRAAGTAGDRYQAGGAEFDGVNDHVFIGTPAKLELVPRTNAFSLSVCGKPSAAATAASRWFGRQGTATNQWWCAIGRLYSSTPAFNSMAQAIVGGEIWSSSTMITNTFAAITITVPAASTGGVMYVNGAVAISNQAVGNSANDATVPWRVGSRGTSTAASLPARGVLSAACAHNCVLTPAEASLLHNIWRAKYGS